MSNAKRRHRRRRRVWRRARMLAAVREAALLGAEWIEVEFGRGAVFAGWVSIRPMGSRLEL